MRPIGLRTSDGVQLAAAEAGAGARGVVLVHELGRQGMCGWWDYAAYLSTRGFHVLLFDHRCVGDSGCPAGGNDRNGLMSDIDTAGRFLRVHGARKLVLIGASQGASEVLIAGAIPHPRIDGVVALSADELALPLTAPPYPPTARAAAPKLRLPVTLAVEAADRYVSLQDTRRLVAGINSRDKRLIELPAGAGHGWNLVATDGSGKRPPLSDTVVAFLRRVTT
jgi:pimeloyl-ACP methyl ester carboxylesterase